MNFLPTDEVKNSDHFISMCFVFTDAPGHEQMVTGATNEESRALEILRKNSAATPKINFQKKLSVLLILINMILETDLCYRYANHLL